MALGLSSVALIAPSREMKERCKAAKWLTHGVGIYDEFLAHSGCQFASADASRESPQGDSRSASQIPQNSFLSHGKHHEFTNSGLD